MFDNWGYFISVLLHGMIATVELTVLGIVLCTAISLTVGMALLHRSTAIRLLARIYVEGWRGTSEVVQLFWIYFAVPLLVGFQLVPLWAGVLVVGLNTGAYGSEIVRGAIQSVDRAQYEAGQALNLTRAQRMFRVIVPQAIPEMIPPLNNLYIQLLKGTSLVSLINVTEITYQGRQVLENNYPGQTLVIFLMMLFLYLCLAGIITAVMRPLERAAARMVGKSTSRRRSGNPLRAFALVRGAR